VNIKDRVNRQSVIDALKSIQARMKLVSWLPANGLAIYCGLIADGKTHDRVLHVVEPIRPVPVFIYRCDSKFHTDVLKEMLQDTDRYNIVDNSLDYRLPTQLNDILICFVVGRYGFIVVDGNGALFATVSGNSPRILEKYQTSLPKKHRRGGQSAPRFARLRLEARHHYLTKVCTRGC
jgi:peptide chain release factor subunit 1